MIDAMKAAFEKWKKTLSPRFWEGPPPITIPFEAGYELGYQAALSEQEQLYDACDKAKSYLSEFAKVAKASGLNIPSSWEFCIEQQPAQPTVKESLTVQAQPICEPVFYADAGTVNGYQSEYITKSSVIGIRTGDCVNLSDIPLYAAPPDFAAIRAENERLKKQSSGKGFIGQTQEFLHDPDNGIYGDCQRAVIASLFCLPIADVPHFFKDGTAEAYWDSLQKFCNSRGFAYIEMGSVQFNAWAASFDVDVYHEISGQSPRGSDLSHAVVGKNGNVFFDPHPSRDGLVGDKSKWTYSFLVKL